jgi:hypothetical protein
MKKALVVYYSQSGQAKEIVSTIVNPLQPKFEIVFEELKPLPSYPFPWTGMSFFQTFPESVQEIPCTLQHFSFNPDENFDLVILAFQVWYLSPSIPINSFLQSPEGKRVLKNKPVITIQGVRNMWVMSQEKVKKKIIEAGGNLVGNIVLRDHNPNLVSVITIVKWMNTADKKGPEKDIQESEKYGEVILTTLREGAFDKLQERLLLRGAVKINPVLASIEKRGLMMFRIWSKFILKKGGYNSIERIGRLKLFKYYLFAVIYIISPLVSIAFYLIHKINKRGTIKMIDYYSGTEYRDQ